MKVQLSWEDSLTQEQQQPIFPLPLVVGREIEQLPRHLDGQEAARLVFKSSEISRYHALFTISNDKVVYEDRSANGTLIDGEKLRQARRILRGGEILQIGPYDITVTLVPEQALDATQSVTIGSTQVLSQNATLLLEPRIEVFRPRPTVESTRPLTPSTNLLQIPVAPRPPLSTPPAQTFPPPGLFAAERISINAIQSLGLPVEEAEYLALGGGMGSFAWVDALRIRGVKPQNIRVISIAQKPYERYERLLTNCQIPRWKRIRSGSDSCPDNLWGWPGYAIRDAWRAVFSGRVVEALGFLWQVFSEPTFADTYTPRAGDVFESMDREAKRIDWNSMVRFGNIRGIRKTEDGRYVVAYSATRPGHTDHRFLIARYVQLATGYPAIKLLDDLREYRERTGDLKKVVHGYEPHDHIYESLERNGGTVIIRGFGIVASQAMDRLYEARKKNPRISVIHLSRSPKQGNKAGPAKRYVENHWEFQPFNWPKGTWGGDMRAKLEAANPLQRREMLDQWGGTTTASRGKWRRSINQGLREGWYKIEFGKVEHVELNPAGKPLTTIQLAGAKGELKVEADFVIDCTGLVSDPTGHPLLNDLIVHYNLPLNPHGRLHVSNDFELTEMRNGNGRMYGAGIITLGGPYAPVDTFLGLQYCAHRSTEHLHHVRAPGVGSLSGIGSLWQWLKWATNQSP